MSGVRVLVAEKIGDSGIELLRQHFDVDLGVGESSGILVEPEARQPLRNFSHAPIPKNELRNLSMAAHRPVGPMSKVGNFQKSARANAMYAFPVCDQTADIPGGPVRAMKRLMHCTNIE